MLDVNSANLPVYNYVLPTDLPMPMPEPSLPKLPNKILSMPDKILNAYSSLPLRRDCRRVSITKIWTIILTVGPFLFKNLGLARGHRGYSGGICYSSMLARWR